MDASESVRLARHFRALGFKRITGAGDRDRIQVQSDPSARGVLKSQLAVFPGEFHMLERYTAKYTRIRTGYMGQLVEWPEVGTEGKTLEECREMLQDALREMVLAYRKQKRELPTGGALLEQIPVKV